MNLWSTEIQDKGYSQSYQVGFYEYFLLCEDLHMEPLPVVWAGLSCQGRSKAVLPTESTEFDEQVVQNALDLIEYANEDPAKSNWAKLRADAGHPEPFHMKMIQIGNENYGDDYIRKFEKVKQAIQEKYPEIHCVLCTGGSPDGRQFDDLWQYAKEKQTDVFIDEHFYKRPEWVLQNTKRYDSYGREGPKVFLGEYAAHGFALPNDNCFETALAEAAFLTGVERNSDVVSMTSYAPLLCLAEGNQWKHNLIDFNPRHVLKTVNYYVQQMFSNSVGKNTLEVIGIIPEGAFVSVMENDGKLFVKLVNTGNQPLEVSVELPMPCHSVTQVQLQSDDLNAKNILFFHGEPQCHVEPSQKTLSLQGQTLSLAVPKFSITILSIEKNQPIGYREKTI